MKIIDNSLEYLTIINKTHIKRSYIRIIITGSLIATIVLTIHCEGKDRFYRPNIPEKLCSIGIIDVDDTIIYSSQNPFSLGDNLRFISFEKSFQSEYPEEKNDSLRNFSFSISSTNKELINYHFDSALTNLQKFKLPTTEFRSGEKYFLKAHDDGTTEISSEVTVPSPPPSLILNSVRKESIAITQSSDCYWPLDDSLKLAIIDISFNNEEKSYYALLLKGIGINFNMPPGIMGYIDFSIQKSNIQGFIATLPGLESYHLTCNNKRMSYYTLPVKAFIMDGHNITNDKCNLTLLVKFNDGYSLFNVFSSFQIRLLTIPREFYLFEKSLYTYDQVVNDPFSEPAYLNGNIKNGNGIFAICRSTQITKILPFPPSF